MSTTTSYPAGVPCWVDTFQPNPEAATRFYGALLGWTFDDPIAMPDGLSGEYRLARSSGHVVAGIGQAPTASPSAVWTTYVAVDDVDSNAFYGRLFGWTLEPVPGAPMAFWRLTGHVGGVADQLMPRDVVAVLAAIGDDDPTPPHWSVAFTVADVDATARLASELGGAVLLSPTDTPGLRSAVIADTQGGVVAITAQSTTP